MIVNKKGNNAMKYEKKTTAKRITIPKEYLKENDKDTNSIKKKKRRVGLRQVRKQ